VATEGDPGVTLQIAEGLARSCRRNPARIEWLAQLPDIVAELTRRWSLSLGPPFLGDDVSCGWVTHATRADGTPVVLKLGMPHFEGLHELAGLRFWKGDVTVALLDADEVANAMLLEACIPGTSLRGLAESEQDVVLATLLRRLWRDPPPDSDGDPRGQSLATLTPGSSFRSLASMLARWAAETRAQEDAWPDPGLVRAGLALFEELTRTTERHVVLFTDLHAGNVLHAERAPWLAIDPKPFVGDAAYDATQHLINCPERMRDTPHATIARFADLLGVSGERVRRWMFARAAAEPRDGWATSPWLAVARALAP
jgi:streptomycin 6-kinase